MSYMLLIVEPIGQRAQRTPEAGQAAYDSMLQYAADLKSRGLLQDAQSLKSETDGVKLQVRDGRQRLLDGPYAEAKEMIGGFFLLNCETREQAVAIAAECPAAQWCTVEIRELGPCFA
ncbi:YciI family protein [Bordetella tumulicola]|uniref:YciI family protein n=1 Tax=Bordetella tumulicola TaxID=1649133 RepID=UPI0039EF7B1F